MNKEELKCGDIVIVDEYGHLYEAMIIALVRMNHPLVIKIDDLKMDIYNPVWITYENIIDAPYHDDIKKALLISNNKSSKQEFTPLKQLTAIYGDIEIIDG